MRLILCACLMAVFRINAASNPPALHLIANLPSPQPVGTVVGLTTLSDYAGHAVVVFRYSVSVDDGPFHIVRDFSQDKFFAWRPELYEHQARVRVTARDGETKQADDAELTFRIVSRITGSLPVVTPTAHPLVALFSAPSCPEGSQFHVVFQRDGDSTHRTGLEPCRGSRSSNQYVAGMRGDSHYRMHGEVVAGARVEPGPTTVFHTGMPGGNFPTVHVVTPRNPQSGSSEPILVTAGINLLNGSTDPMRPIATDLDGDLVWYLPKFPDYFAHVLTGGRFLIEAGGINAVNEMRRVQLLEEVDLAGNTLRETNIGRVAEQLEAYGIKSECKKDGQQCLSGFHHDALRLPNGHTLAIAGLERKLPAGTQGSKEPVDILGDVVVDLDPELQVVWIWNAFDRMDVNRASRNPTALCRQGPGSGGCPPVFLAASAKGWLHSNSLNYDPRDGNVVISIPEQDWVIKIDYQNGKGSGKVIWRLGLDGDFKAVSADPYPWFSYQHDAGFDPPGSDTISLFDDGHELKKKFPQASSRGQVWKLDEKALVATLTLNADVAVYAAAVGSAQRLLNGNYHFDAGFVNGVTSVFGRSIEVAPDGKIVYALQVDGQITYRTFRLIDLYTPTIK